MVAGVDLGDAPEVPAVNISITHTGFQEERDRADRYQATYRRLVWEAMDWFGRTVVSEMQTDHPYQDRTGWLTASQGYAMDPLNDEGSISGSVYALAWYASAVEAGTPHSRPYPFFWPKFYKFLPMLMSRIELAMKSAEAEASF